VNKKLLPKLVFNILSTEIVFSIITVYISTVVHMKGTFFLQKNEPDREGSNFLILSGAASFPVLGCCTFTVVMILNPVTSVD
jgi:hypothetical protein